MAIITILFPRLVTRSLDAKSTAFYPVTAIFFIVWYNQQVFWPGYPFCRSGQANRLASEPKNGLTSLTTEPFGPGFKVQSGLWAVSSYYLIVVYHSFRSIKLLRCYNPEVVVALWRLLLNSHCNMPVVTNRKSTRQFFAFTRCDMGQRYQNYG